MLMLVEMTFTKVWIGREEIQRSIISTGKQAISIKLAATVGQDKIYFSPKSSVAFTTNKVTQAPPACHMQSGQCLFSERPFGVEMKDVIDADVKRVPLPPTNDVCTRGDIVGRVLDIIKTI